jgi:hypothetical protein
MGIKPSGHPYRIVVAVVIIVVIASVSWWAIRQPDVEKQATPIQVEEISEVAGETQSIEEVEQENAQEGEALTPTKRIVHVPDTREPDTLTEYEESRYLEINGENLARIATSALEKALDGDMQAATGLPRLRTLCRDNFTDEEWVEEEIQKTMNGLRDGSIPPEGETVTFTSMEGLGFTAYPTEAENRTHMMQWFRACEHVRAIWTQDTRRQLEELASEGHVMARYIYATWVPEWKLDSDSFSQFTEYQSNALEYSIANLEEGEVAGLVAFGLSYWGLHFTPTFPDLGTAFLKAALDCGLQSGIIENRVYHRAGDGTVDTSNLRNWYGGDPEAVLMQAEELSKICR